MSATNEVIKQNILTIVRKAMEIQMWKTVTDIKNEKEIRAYFFINTDYKLFQVEENISHLSYFECQTF